MPNPAKPVERKRKLGASKRPLPDQVFVAEQVSGVPVPLEPLGRVGLDAWSRIWNAGASWIAYGSDAQWVQRLCELEDERAGLRARVLEDGDWRDRVGLRALETSINSMYSMMGFNPVDRGKMGVGEVRASSVLDELRARRAVK